jgi:hypothetical protein
VNEITGVVLTRNEEKHIAECLASLEWCNELLVFDSLSSDRTVQIARQAGARVLERPFTNFAEQRNAAIEKVETEWLLFVDADERIPPALAEKILKVIQDPAHDGWWIPTRNNYFGHWLKYSGMWPDHHLRLARKNKLHYDSSQKVHEHPDPIDQAGYLTNPLIHLCYQKLGDMIEAKSRYATLLAEIHYDRGLKPTYHLLAAPLLTFWEFLFRKQSYRDGWVGILISVVWAYYAFEEYRRVWRFWKQASQPRTGQAGQA